MLPVEICRKSKAKILTLALEEIIFPFKLYWRNVELLLALKCTMEHLFSFNSKFQEVHQLDIWQSGQIGDECNLVEMK